MIMCSITFWVQTFRKYNQLNELLYIDVFGLAYTSIASTSVPLLNTNSFDSIQKMNSQMELFIFYMIVCLKIVSFFSRSMAWK